jgi:ferritin-like metal-binding protein YciE
MEKIPAKAVPVREPRQRTAPEKDANLRMLFVDEIKEIYGAEQHQLLVLPLMKKAASSLRLQNVLAGHLDCTRDHAERLEQVFKKMRQKPEARKSETILGIARECETAIATTEKGTATRDAGIILAVQKLEHYEIGTYGTLTQMARTLDLDDIADLLEMNLLDEKEADDLLTSLAENYINLEASRE